MRVFLAAGGGEAIIIALGILAVLVVLIVEMASREKRRKAWAAVAERLGLSAIAPDHLVGTLDGAYCEADIFTKGSGKNRRTYTRIRASGGLPDDVQLAKEGFFSTLFGDDIKTGDAAFDGAVRVRGEPGAVLALLDAPMRAHLRRVIEHGWQLEGGVWTYTVQRRLGAEIEPLIQAGTRLVAEVREASTTMASRLLERVRSEPEAGVRRRCLAHLIARLPTSKATAAALELALRDGDPGIRFDAAQHLGDIEALAALATAREGAEDLRAQAAKAAAQAPERPCARAMASALTAELASGGMSVALRLALAELLGRVSEGDAERTLVGLLADADDAVQLAAMRSLGQVGSIAAVPALIPFRDRFLAFASQSAGVAKDAILAIQARAGRAEAGGLALAEAGGALAVAEQEEA